MGDKPICQKHQYVLIQIQHMLSNSFSRDLRFDNFLYMCLVIMLNYYNLCKKLHVFVITLIHKGYLPNSLNMAIFVDFLFIFDMNFKNFIWSLSHKTFSNKFSMVKSAFLIFDDKIFTVPQISLP